MKIQGYGMLLVSIQVDESAQHFYRKIGYKDCGGFTIDIPKYANTIPRYESVGFIPKILRII